MRPRDVRDPKDLSVYFHTAQTLLGQVLFFQSEKCEMRQVTEHGLKPTMLPHDLAYAWILKLVYVKREHRDVLGSTRGGDGIENGF